MEQKWKMHDQLGILISTIARMSRTRFDQRASKLGLTRPQWRTLNCIKYEEGLNQSQLSAMLEVGHITVTRQLDILEGIGWVERRPDPGDRRAHRLYLTPAAGQILADINATVDDIHCETYAGISEREQEQLKKTLTKLYNNLAAGLKSGTGKDTDSPGSEAAARKAPRAKKTKKAVAQGPGQ